MRARISGDIRENEYLPESSVMSARYAIWKGDECIAVGTAKELAKRLGVKVKTIYWMASPANRKRDNGHHRVAERI